MISEVFISGVQSICIMFIYLSMHVICIYIYIYVYTHMMQCVCICIMLIHLSMYNAFYTYPFAPKGRADMGGEGSGPHHGGLSLRRGYTQTSNTHKLKYKEHTSTIQCILLLLLLLLQLLPIIIMMIITMILIIRL